MASIMVWLIALIVVAVIAIAGYRIYFNPPLSNIAKEQKERYIQQFQREKVLIYQMSMNQIEQLVNYLNKSYRNAGFGCYYGRGIIIHLEVNPPETTLTLFSPDDSMLVRHAWKIMQVKNNIGGAANGITHG